MFKTRTVVPMAKNVGVLLASRLVRTFTEAYYAYLFVFCGRYVKEDTLRFALAAVFHLLLLFCLWSYARTTFTRPPSVPRRFQFTKGERRELACCSRNTQCENVALEAMATRRGILTRCRNGAISCCNPCQLVKPDRCHHCSRCVLKMDHHCPWFNNCVCFSTYKFFVLTLFYIAFLAAYVLGSVSVYLLHKSRNRSLLHRSRHITFLVMIDRRRIDVSHHRWLLLHAHVAHSAQSHYA
ncbi:hypothetical protein HPB49_022874 [Dermacentor silvarum]|uniref:Uncharacterized protein n=1 Tax=Dermacentor silvarum TaxID=543639 RepID=A0ACB8CBR6_DERSI|nr:hypothetical protein HPB49_022874 [Dermacentor silvarum]